MSVWSYIQNGWVGEPEAPMGQATRADMLQDLYGEGLAYHLDKNYPLADG